MTGQGSHCRGATCAVAGHVPRDATGRWRFFEGAWRGASGGGEWLFAARFRCGGWSDAGAAAAGAAVGDARGRVCCFGEHARKCAAAGGGRPGDGAVVCTALIFFCFLFTSNRVPKIKTFWCLFFFMDRCFVYTHPVSKTTLLLTFRHCLTICFIKTFYINIVYFDMTYLIIKGTLIIIYLF